MQNSLCQYNNILPETLQIIIILSIKEYDSKRQVSPSAPYTEYRFMFDKQF